jgi:hypothetical protein
LSARLVGRLAAFDSCSAKLHNQQLPKQWQHRGGWQEENFTNLGLGGTKLGNSMDMGVSTFIPLDE